MLPPHPIAQRGSAILWLCSEYATVDSQLPTCDSLTDGQIINFVSTSSQVSPAGSDEGEEEEEDGDGMLQDERVSPSVAVGAIDTFMRYFEQCQLTTPDDIEHLSAIKRRVDYMRLATQKQSSIRDYFKPWHDQLTKTKTAVNLL